MGETLSKVFRGDRPDSFDLPKTRDSYKVRREETRKSPYAGTYKEFHGEGLPANFAENSKQICKRDGAQGSPMSDFNESQPDGLMSKAEVAQEFDKIKERSSHMLNSLTHIPCGKLTDEVSHAVEINMKMMKDCMKHRNSIGDQDIFVTLDPAGPSMSSSSDHGGAKPKRPAEMKGFERKSSERSNAGEQAAFNYIDPDAQEEVLDEDDFTDQYDDETDFEDDAESVSCSGDDESADSSFDTDSDPKTDRNYDMPDTAEILMTSEIL